MPGFYMIATLAFNELSSVGRDYSNLSLLVQSFPNPKNEQKGTEFFRCLCVALENYPFPPRAFQKVVLK